MTRSTRIIAAITIALLAAACDKCGDFRLGLSGSVPLAACSSDKPQG